MQGLGGETTTISTAQALPPPTTTAAPFPTNNATATIGWEACQTSQVSWSEAWTSAYQPETVTTTETNTLRKSTITFNVSFGIADVYTTIEGIPHAHGELKATSTSQFVEYVFLVFLQDSCSLSQHLFRSRQTYGHDNGDSQRYLSECIAYLQNCAIKMYEPVGILPRGTRHAHNVRERDRACYHANAYTTTTLLSWNCNTIL